MELVIVDWVDSRVDGGWSTNEEYTSRAEPLEIVSAGFLLQETDAYITLVQNVSEHLVAETVSIPKGCVVEITRTGYMDEMQEV